MAYNGYFPAYYPPLQANNFQNGNGSGSGIIWVQGEAGAKSYLVAPNNTVQLWDSEAQTIYLKSADASGMPSMKILDYSIRNTSQTSQNGSESFKTSEGCIYTTKQDLDEIRGELERLKGQVEKLTKGASEDE